MPEHIIRNYKGTPISWSKNTNNEDFCLLYNDNNGKYTFTPNENLNCQLYMFGGGGAGGYFFGGGGGAGAAYINKNYTFEKNKTYTFEIGTGGKCDINNINLLFTPGIQLKVFNNTNPTLNNFSFIGEDYSNINIDNNSARTYIVQDLTIDPSLFSKNTTYIWEGYIKGNTDKNYNFSIVSNLKTFVWIQDFENDDMSSLNLFNSKSNNNDALLLGGYNFNQHPFSKQLKNNIFYKIKIIAYNNNEIVNNFNIKIDSDCEIYNFNKENENYKFIKSSDTTLTYNNEDGTFGSIICIGGGNGGCGLYNQDNSYLNGGCGGGSGLNKIKGISKIQPIYNGFDGAIGTYCGGGGGIMSAGNNANGGDGLILNWFNDSLIFGAGGNASGNNKTRNIGYGCGGNGGTCCYYSKTSINNNGNNGCILIYIRTENFTTFEGFTNKDDNLYGTNTVIPSNSIVYKLLDETLNLKNLENTTRKEYFEKSDFAKMGLNRPATSPDNMPMPAIDNLGMELYINDLLVISKLYTTFFRTISHTFNYNLNNNLVDCKFFIDNLRISHSATSKALTAATATVNDAANCLIILANDALTMSSLNLTEDNTNTNKNTLYRITDNIITENNNYNFPMYHDVYNKTIPILGDLQSKAVSYHYNYSNIKFNYLSSAIRGNYSTSVDTSPHAISLTNYATAPTASDVTSLSGITYSVTGNFTHVPISSTGATTLTLKVFASSTTYITKATIKNACENYKLAINTNANLNDYYKARIFLYLDVFNKVLNTDFNILLPTLKYYMFYYNVLVYNVSIQYAYFNLQNYLLINDNPRSSIFTTQNYNFSSLNTDINKYIENFDNNIKYNFNRPSNYLNIKNDNIFVMSNVNDIKTIFNENQTKLNSVINKYNNYLTMYNNIIFYYKIIIAFAIFLTIVIILIFSSSLIDNNSKISIYIFIGLLIVVLLFLYNNNITIENFTTIYDKAATIYGTLSGNLNISKYKEKATNFLNYLAINVSSADSGLFATDISSYMRSLTLDKKRKAEFYKIKYTTLENNIEIMKKSINYYYYLIVFIASLIIILMIGLILYLSFPQLLLQIIILCVILLILSVYYFTYKIHRTTRIYENKNYWANYNPSRNTLDNM